MKILAVNTLGDFDCTNTRLYKGGDLSPQPQIVIDELNSYIEPPVIVDGFQMNCRSSSDQHELFELFDSILKGHGYYEYKPKSISIGD